MKPMVGLVVVRGWLVVLGATLLVSGCDDGGPAAGAADAGAADAGAADVLAGDIGEGGEGDADAATPPGDVWPPDSNDVGDGGAAAGDAPWRDGPEPDPGDASGEGDAPDTMADAVADAGPEVDGGDAIPEVDAGPLPLPAAPGIFAQLSFADVILDDDGESEELYVVLPPGTTSAFVLVSGPDDKAFFTLKKVITPPPYNQMVVKGAGDAVCIPCANRVVSAQKVAAFLVPNDPDIPVGGGEWLFKVRSAGILKTAVATTYIPVAGVCDVTILARTEPVPDAGSIRLHLHFTGSGGLTAASAPTDERLQAGLVVAGEVLAAAGISMDVVEEGGYHDVPGVAEDPTLAHLESTLGAPNDLSKLLLTGQAEDVGAINVFFVGSIFRDGDWGGGGLVLGIAGGVPGPAFIGPSYRSGVVVATFELGGEEDFLGNVLAHELGHYLGLFHTTEQESLFHDTLDDTADDDPTNLMYWAYSEAQRDISESQAWVMRSHPMVSPIVWPTTETP